MIGPGSHRTETLEYPKQFDELALENLSDKQQDSYSSQSSHPNDEDNVLKSRPSLKQRLFFETSFAMNPPPKRDSAIVSSIFSAPESSNDNTEPQSGLEIRDNRTEAEIIHPSYQTSPIPFYCKKGCPSPSAIESAPSRQYRSLPRGGSTNRYEKDNNPTAEPSGLCLLSDLEPISFDVDKADLTTSAQSIGADVTNDSSMTRAIYKNSSPLSLTSNSPVISRDTASSSGRNLRRLPTISVSHPSSFRVRESMHSPDEREYTRQSSHNSSRNLRSAGMLTSSMSPEFASPTIPNYLEPRQPFAQDRLRERKDKGHISEDYIMSSSSQQTPLCYCGKEIGSFEVIRHLGTGSFATVWLAADRSKQTDHEQIFMDEASSNTSFATIPKLFALKCVDRLERQNVSMLQHEEVIYRVLFPNVPYTTLKQSTSQPTHGISVQSATKRRPLDRHLAGCIERGRSRVVEFFGSMQTPDLTILMLEYAPGPDLFDYLMEHYSVTESGHAIGIPENNAMSLFKMILEGIYFMHSQNVAHCDLKLENILISSTNPLQIKIIDFGLAQEVQDGNKLTHIRKGSEPYLAPEMVMQKPTDPFKSDVWALGVILFAILTSRMPFDPDEQLRGAGSGASSRSSYSTSSKSIMFRIARGSYRYNDTEEKCISENAKAIVNQCLTRDLQQRVTIAELLQNEWISSRASQDNPGTCAELKVNEGSSSDDTDFTSSPPSISLRSPKRRLSNTNLGMLSPLVPISENNHPS